MSLKHCRKNDAMENNIVFTNKMQHSGIRVFPPFLPIIWQKLFCVADISNRSIKPHIENLTFGTLNRHRNSPIEITAYSPWLQTHIEPTFTLTINIRFPLFMIFQYPLTKPCFVLV